MAAQEYYVANDTYSDNVLQHGYFGRRAWNIRARRRQQRRMRQQFEERTMNVVTVAHCLINEVEREG